MLLAGDLYDGDWKDYSTGIFLGKQMGRLARHGIDVFIVPGVEHYLRLRTAAKILEEKIEDYCRKNQVPVLARAGQIFAGITLGSFKNLRDELNNGKPILLGVRPDDKEVLAEEMSDGTRD